MSTARHSLIPLTRWPVKVGRSCTGKRKYFSLIDALVDCHQVYRVWHDSQFVYHCVFGEHYHLGHTPESVRLLIAELVKCQTLSD